MFKIIVFNIKIFCLLLLNFTALVFLSAFVVIVVVILSKKKIFHKTFVHHWTSNFNTWILKALQEVVSFLFFKHKKDKCWIKIEASRKYLSYSLCFNSEANTQKAVHHTYKEKTQTFLNDVLFCLCKQDSHHTTFVSTKKFHRLFWSVSSFRVFFCVCVCIFWSV